MSRIVRYLNTGSHHVAQSGLVAEYQTLLDEYRQQLEAQRLQIDALQSIIQTLAEKEASKYDMRGAQFSGGFAETVNGHQISTDKCAADIDTS